MMYELIEIWNGAVQVLDYGLTWADCQAAMALEVYLSDGLGRFACDTMT